MQQVILWHLLFMDSASTQNFFPVAPLPQSVHKWTAARGILPGAVDVSLDTSHEESPRTHFVTKQRLQIFLVNFKSSNPKLLFPEGT